MERKSGSIVKAATKAKGTPGLSVQKSSSSMKSGTESKAASKAMDTSEEGVPIGTKLAVHTTAAPQKRVDILEANWEVVTALVTFLGLDTERFPHIGNFVQANWFTVCQWRRVRTESKHTKETFELLHKMYDALDVHLTRYQYEGDDYDSFVEKHDSLTESEYPFHPYPTSDVLKAHFTEYLTKSGFDARKFTNLPLFVEKYGLCLHHTFTSSVSIYAPCSFNVNKRNQLNRLIVVHLTGKEQDIQWPIDTTEVTELTKQLQAYLIT
ncbi:Hypothetical protein POVN_LOCUS161 [uncultured virus]|nr:Hypothetical protein POVN_LOCUS161 [uncultured virus]